MKPLAKLLYAELFVLVVSSLPLVGQSNPAVGTWKLDVADSKFSSASPPKGATRTVAVQGDSLSVSNEFVESDGSTTKYGYTASFDEKDCQISGSGRSNWREDWISGAETIALRRLASNTFAGALKKSGNVVMTSRTVVSKGGKVTTVTTSGGDAKGQPTKTVLVWDKQ